jgi:5-methylcytosine-specific restriction endonuclease McrBC regulatory subunit McrC
MLPDIWLEWESATLIVDAKYKRHWEELQQRSWMNVEEELREQYRNDLLQVLAYANLARANSDCMSCVSVFTTKLGLAPRASTAGPPR